tara:strand:+ start:250 stop:720 length:471 start_codon:yes stop_codon:yes gene_type:complete
LRLTVNFILLNPLDKAKTQLVGEIDELDNKKDWIDWITKYGDDISKRFEKPTTELLEGMIDTIVVSPIFALNRDEVEKQSGHKLTVNFKQPIVDDSIVYEDEKNKSKGYNVVNGKKKLNAGNLAILKGGRGNTAKKSIKIDMVKNRNAQINSVTVE